MAKKKDNVTALPTAKSAAASKPTLNDIKTDKVVGGFIEVSNSLVGLTDSALKSIGILSACTVFGAPFFASQANPQNIVGLADMFYKYMTGEVSVGATGVVQPDAEQVQKANEPTFA